MSDNLIIKHLHFETEDYERLLKIIGGHKNYEELLRADAILISTKTKAETIVEYIKKPFSQLRLSDEKEVEVTK